MTEELSLAEQFFEQVRTGSAARKARLAAARGTLPFSRAELVRLQVLLTSDGDEEVKQTALTSLESLTGQDGEDLAADAEASQELLHFLSGWLSRWKRAGPVLARRRDAVPATMRLLAGTGHLETLEALVSNQVALRADPELPRLLLDNSALEKSTRLRLLDYVDEIDKDVARSAEAVAPADSLETSAREEVEEPDTSALETGQPRPAEDPFLASLGVDAEVEALLPSLGLDIGQLAERSVLLGEDLDDADEGMIKRLSGMNVGQKLRVALFGSKGERNILVRDSNRIVAAAVVKNPKFTDSEADAVAKSRNVSDEVLRLIGRHRDFAKQYAIQHSLVVNPRTPMDIARGFIPFLNDRDLNMVAKSRNVSDMVRRQAKKVGEIRLARKQGRRPGT